jgi:colanic acid/amylovoran biosynthesis glycosyltransferase
LIRDRGVEVRCRIVGIGEQEPELRAAIERLGLGNRVELPGPRPQGDLIKAVRRAAVFAAPCVVGGDGNRDGLPTVLLEAMALGTPCVSTDVTGIPEVLRNGETGLMVPQRDPAALADAIERLLVDPELRVRLAGRARQLVEAEFDVRRNAALLREMFEAAHAVAAWRAS